MVDGCCLNDFTRFGVASPAYATLFLADITRRPRPKAGAINRRTPISKGLINAGYFKKMTE